MSRLARIDSDDTETDVVSDRLEDPADDNGWGAGVLHYCVLNSCILHLICDWRAAGWPRSKWPWPGWCMNGDRGYKRRGATWHLALGEKRGLTHSLRIPSQPSWNNLASAAVHFVIKSCSELTLIRRNQFSPRFRLNPAVGDDARLGLCLNHNWCRLIKSDHLRNASDLTFTNVISLIFTATAPTQFKRKIKSK